MEPGQLRYAERIRQNWNELTSMPELKQLSNATEARGKYLKKKTTEQKNKSSAMQTLINSVLLIINRGIALD